MSFEMTADRDAQLEKLVFMNLRQTGLHPEYDFTRSGAAVDLVVKPVERSSRRLIQVYWNLADKETRAR